MENARRSIFHHVNFLANINVKAAKRLLIQIEEEVLSLRYMPYKWPKVIIFNQSYRKLILSKKITILYFIKGNIIYIDNVIDNRQGKEF